MLLGRPKKTQATRQITGGYSDLKQGFNLERLEQPNVEQKSLIAARSRALRRSKRIDTGVLVPESSRGWLLLCSTMHEASHWVHKARSTVRSRLERKKRNTIVKGNRLVLNTGSSCSSSRSSSHCTVDPDGQGVEHHILDLDFPYSLGM